jgi:hypothetical protein
MVINFIHFSKKLGLNIKDEECIYLKESLINHFKIELINFQSKFFKLIR